MNLRLLMLLLLATLVAGCNFGPGGGGDDDDATGDDDDTTGGEPVETTIAELNAGDVANGTLVTVSGVITTPYDEDEDDNEARFWIQDGSGPGTGMQIFTFPDVVAELDDSNIAEGDEVEVTGLFDAPFDFNEIRVTSTLNVTKTGTGTMPAPHPVSAEDIEGGFAPNDLVGVLVELTDVTVDVAGGWDNYWEWEAEGAIVDSLFYYADVVPGGTVDSLVGLLFLDFGNAVVAPRWSGDVDFTYAGCDTAADSDVRDINCREVEEEDGVTLEGLIVISPAPWFSDSSFYAVDPAGDFFAGLLVNTNSEDPAPAIGTEVDVEGDYEEYRGQTQVFAFGDDISVGDDGNDVTPMEVTDACAVGEAHEGMLVTIPSVAVTQDSDGADFGYYTITGCDNVVVGGEFWGDFDEFNSDTGGEGTITDLVGVVNDELDTYAINPRTDSDWASWE
ncbi:MAG: hypothetical protein GY898_19350 [Proteobacteria bacterium]|nr:hypothetical protein [Pseudomonadota bacterium]